MSLKIWLPLNGSMENQGLLGELAVSSATPIYASGKIGQALGYGYCTMSAEQTAQVLNNSELSICFWIYVNADTGTSSNNSSIIFGNNSNVSDTNNRKYSLFLWPTVNDLHWSWQNDTTHAENGTVTFTSGHIDGVLPSYVWTHVAVTYKNPNGTIYINGVKVTEFTGVSNSSSFAYQTNVINSNNNRRLNDYRVYDHCLSTKEVKELAKGMVLHNKFSGIGAANLLLDSYSCASWSNTGFIQNTSDSDGSTIFSAIRSGLSADNIYSITPNIISRSDALELGGITISFDFIHERILYNSSNQELDNKNILVVAAITSNNTQISWNIPDLDLGNFDGEWRRISVSLTSNDLLKSETGNYTPDDIVGFSISIRIVRNGTFHVKHIKVEKGLKGTPWVPNKADPEYETLGFNYYCNFLDNSGNHSYTGITHPDTVDLISDSPRFGTAVRFKGYTADSIGVENASTIYIEGWKYTYTISIWMKFSELKNINMLIFGDVTLKTDGTHFFINDYQYTELAPFNDNDWHMYVITSSDATPYAPLLFIDGVKYKSNAVSTVMGDLRIPLSSDNDHAALLIPNQSTAADSMNITCVSDLRIYSTILDPVEVESMYKTSASINRDGTMFACEFKEEK